MAEIKCKQCNATINAADNAAFCPFCGAKLQGGGPDLTAVSGEPDPVKKHQQLLALQEQYPDNAAIAEEILHLGRLYDRGKKGMDFSVIKCYVLNVYLEPAIFRKNKREELQHEIFHHPDLDTYLALSPDRNIALRRYLERLSEEFIRLFLKGSTRHMHAIFGYMNESKAPKHLAQPACAMLLAMHKDASLTGEQQQMLMQAFYTAFSRQLGGETQYLDALIAKYKLPVTASIGE